MTDYSLNETASYAKLAAKGAGYSWGMAEEVGRAVYWLVSRGLPGPAMLLELLSNYSTTESVKLAMPSVNDNRFTTEYAWLCPVASGCALSDSCVVVDDATHLSLTNVKCPILLLPFVAEVAQRFDRVLALDIGNDIVSTDGDQIRIPNIDSMTLEQSTMVVCRSAKAEEFKFDSAYLRKPGQRVVVEHRVWEALGAYAHRTYAPSTERSRELGAGAGLSDND